MKKSLFTVLSIAVLLSVGYGSVKLVNADDVVPIKVKHTTETIKGPAFDNVDNVRAKLPTEFKKKVKTLKNNSFKVKDVKANHTKIGGEVDEYTETYFLETAGQIDILTLDGAKKKINIPEAEGKKYEYFTLEDGTKVRYQENQRFQLVVWYDNKEKALYQVAGMKDENDLGKKFTKAELKGIIETLGKVE
jgi:hypothetical protein